MGAPGLQQCTSTILVDTLTRGLRFRKFDKRSEEYVRIDCPSRVAETVLSRAGDRRLKPIIGFIEAPILRPDGTVLMRPGYDDATALVLLGNEQWPSIPNKPNRLEIASAVRTLKTPFTEFPFTGDSDRAVLFSGILTALQRRTLPSGPSPRYRRQHSGCRQKSVSSRYLSDFNGSRTRLHLPWEGRDRTAQITCQYFDSRRCGRFRRQHLAQRTVGRVGVYSDGACISRSDPWCEPTAKSL